MSKTSLGGKNHYATLTKSVGKWPKRGTGFGPSMSLKEASAKFEVPVVRLVGWMHAQDSPRPFSASKSSSNTYYDAKELTRYIRAKLASLKTEA